MCIIGGRDTDQWNRTENSETGQHNYGQQFWQKY